MGDWRRGSYRQHRRGGGGGGGGGDGDGYYGGGRGDVPPRTSSWKPPPSGNRPPTVPSWEKEFCFYVGQIPWKKLLQSKELLPVFKNIVQWDDSAGEEAFRNAKARYWAHINHVPCSIQLPDPDMYIDRVDWDCKIDPQLVADLESRAPPPPVNDEWKSGHLRSGWDSCLVNEPVVPTGWVDAEDCGKPILEPPVPTGWEDWGDGKDGPGNTAWGSSAGWDNTGVAKKDRKWENWERNSRRGNGMERWKSDADNYYSETSRNGKKRGGNGGGWYGSKNPSYGYKWGDGSHGGNNSWRYSKGRRTGQGREWAYDNKEHAHRQWNLPHSSGPVWRQAPGEARGA